MVLFNNAPPPPPPPTLIPSRESPVLHIANLEQYYLAYSLDSQISVYVESYYLSLIG